MGRRIKTERRISLRNQKEKGGEAGVGLHEGRQEPGREREINTTRKKERATNEERPGRRSLPPGKRKRSNGQIPRGK